MRRFFVLVDDDAEDAELFSDALNDIAVPVDFRHFDSGEKLIEALGRAGMSLPHLIFLDLNMPRMTGWECLELLKRKEVLKEIPVVIYSTSSTASDRSHAIRSKAAGYLPKPESFRTLVEKLRVIAEADDDKLDAVLKDL